MAWVFRASDSATTFAETSLTITKPSGVVEDDLMVAYIMRGTGTGAFTAPSGWTIIEDISSGNRSTAYYLVAGGSEPSDYTWSWTGGATAAGVIDAWTGVDTADPLDVSSQATGASSTSHVATGVTTTNDNAMLFAAYSTINLDVVTWTPPTDFAEREDVGVLTASISIHDDEQVSSGASGDKTATADTSSVFHAVLAAFNIAPVTGPLLSAQGLFVLP